MGRHCTRRPTVFCLEKKLKQGLITACSRLSMAALDVVVEFDGQEVPVLAQVDLSSMRTLRLSLAKALCMNKPVDTQLLYWERGRGSVVCRFYPLDVYDVSLNPHLMRRVWVEFSEITEIPIDKYSRTKIKCVGYVDPKKIPRLPKRRLVVLSRESSEFSSCAELLAQEAHPVQISVSCIERVENPLLEARFEARLAELREPHRRLRLLHHACAATKSLTLDVCKRGFHEDHWQDGDFGRGVRRAPALLSSASSPRVNSAS